MCVCVYTHAHICIRLCMHLCIHTYIYMCSCVYGCECVSIHMYIYICFRVCLGMCMYVHVSVYVCLYFFLIDMFSGWIFLYLFPLSHEILHSKLSCSVWYFCVVCFYLHLRLNRNIEFDLTSVLPSFLLKICCLCSNFSI